MTDTFPFQTPRGFLSKARRELDRLLEAVEPEDSEPDRERIGDLTINIAWTLWHVTDWISNNDNPAVARIVASMGVTSTGRARTSEFQQQLRDQSSDLRHCWELATRFKHFELEEGTLRFAELEDFSASASSMTGVHVSCFPYPPEESTTAVSFAGLSNAIAAIPSGMTMEGSLRKTLHPKIQHGGDRLRLTEVYSGAYDYLDRLLKEHRL